MTVEVLSRAGKPPAPQRLRKIAIEEHFQHSFFELHDADGQQDWRTQGQKQHLDLAYYELVAKRLPEFDRTRLQAMDEAGIDISLLSLTSPGVQGIIDPDKAQSVARTVNDFLAERINAHPSRFKGLATIALQDAGVAAKELERCVNQLGFKGAMINGYQQIADDKLLYLDEDRLTPLWEAATALDVPIYLHPRTSYNALQYEGAPELPGAMWGFAPETATHALRLVYAGVFDRFPTAKLIVGHLGETLPFFAWRIQHGFEFNQQGRYVQRRLQDYLADNIWLSTSGNFNTQALHCSLLTVGADRLLFAVDYPYEDMIDGSRFIDTVDIAECDRRKIAHQTAEVLFRL